MEKIRKFVIGFIFIFFALGATAFFWEWLETEKKQAEYYEEQMREHQLTQGLYSSKLFGIQINKEADILLFSLQYQHLIFQMEILMVHDQIGIRSHQTMVSILFKNFMITTLMKWSIVK